MTRKEFEMSPDSLSMLLDAMKPVPLIMLQCGHNPNWSTQERINSAWKALGHRMGFEYMSARPVPGKSERFFTAEPLEGFVEKTHDDNFPCFKETDKGHPQ